VPSVAVTRLHRRFLYKYGAHPAPSLPSQFPSLLDFTAFAAELNRLVQNLPSHSSFSLSLSALLVGLVGLGWFSPLIQRQEPWR